MRLIDTSTGAMKEFHGRDIPRYAILSHTWNTPEEVTYQEYITGGFEHKKGYEKIWKTCSIAKAHNIGYTWIDTCCIDKSSSAELSEAINSMYRWYERSTVCYAFLSDLASQGEYKDALRQCRWFTRGWTLQELIAPSQVMFFDSTWKPRSSKKSAAVQLSEITKIDIRLLLGNRGLSTFSVAQKMSWAANRKTTRVEDEAYCLLGIFDLHMPLLYGEAEKAFRRLQEEIIRYTADLSIFAWTLSSRDQHFVPDTRSSYLEPVLRSVAPYERILCGVLAESPAEFSNCHNHMNHEGDLREFSTSNIGIKTRVRLELKRIALDGSDRYVLPLNCNSNGFALGIHLRQIGRQSYLREDPWNLVRYSLYSLSTIPLIERHLLTEVPTESPPHDVRLGKMAEILRQKRSTLLQIRTDPGLMITDPWPLDRYDHEDQIFFLSGDFGWDFGTVKVEVFTYVHHVDGSVEPVTLRCRFWSLGWSFNDSVRAQFGILEEKVYGGVLDNIQRLASEGDWLTHELLSELRRCKIPKSTATLFSLVGKDIVTVVVSFTAEVTEDANIARGNIWKIRLSQTLYKDCRAPQPKQEDWFVSL